MGKGRGHHRERPPLVLSAGHANQGLPVPPPLLPARPYPLSSTPSAAAPAAHDASCVLGTQGRA
eukprot:1149959-Pelagomonas_calceolata.AAC.11